MLAHCKTFVLLNLIRLPEIQIEASVENLRPCGNSYQGTWPLGLFNSIKQGVEVIEPGDREFVVRLIHYQIVNVAIRLKIQVFVSFQDIFLRHYKYLSY